MEKIIKLEKLEFRFNFGNLGSDALTFEIGGIEFLEWVTKAGSVDRQDSHLAIHQRDALELLEMDADDLERIRDILQDFLNTNADAIKAIAWHEEKPVTRNDADSEY